MSRGSGAAAPPSIWAQVHPHKREFLFDNLLVRIHFIIVMIRWTGLAPYEDKCCGTAGVDSGRVLISLSRGGADATVKREFDLVAMKFVSQADQVIYLYLDKFIYAHIGRGRYKLLDAPVLI